MVGDAIITREKCSLIKHTIQEIKKKNNTYDLQHAEVVYCAQSVLAYLVYFIPNKKFYS